MIRNFTLILIGVMSSTIFLHAQNDRIDYNNQELFISGMNLAWINYANDLTNFNAETFVTALDELKAAKGNCFRWWLHVNGVYSPQFTNDSVSGISQTSVDNLRMALNIAQEKGIGLVLCLWSFGMLNTGDGSLNAAQSARNLLMLEDTVYTKAYINNALIPMVDSVKEHPAIICWEIFNEPEGMASDAHAWAGWTPTQTSFSNIQRFMNLTTGAIHRTDTSALVSSGAWNVAVNTDISIGGLGSSGNLYRDDRLIAAGGDPDGTLDFYMIHFYPDHGTESSPFHHPASYWGLDKPVVVGEFRAEEPYPGITTQAGYQYLYDNGYAGALSWTWTGHDGNGDIFDAEPGMTYLWDNHLADVEILIDSSEIDFTPYIVNVIKDTFLVIPTDTVTVKYVDLKTVFRDVEDSTVLAYSIQDISDTSLVECLIDPDDTLIFSVRPNQPGACSITIRATDSSSKFVENSFTISVYDSTSEDVALYRKATASSIENSGHLAFFAVDGDDDTRWSTEYDDDQYLIIEFEKERNLERLLLDWEAAYGEVYNILVSTDGVVWDTAFNEQYGNGSKDLVLMDPTPARFIMMDGVNRGTQWGYSLWSLQAYESPGTNTAPTLQTTADTFSVLVTTEFELGPIVFFADTTPGDQLTYSYDIIGESGTGEWLTLELPESEDDAVFTGIPLNEDIGYLTVEVEATDRYGESISRTFIINVYELPLTLPKNSLSDVSVYPVPANEKVFINHKNHILTKIELFDMQGRLVWNTYKYKAAGITELDIENLEDGMYYFIIHSVNNSCTRKMVKH